MWAWCNFRQDSGSYLKEIRTNIKKWKLEEEKEFDGAVYIFLCLDILIV